MNPADDDALDRHLRDAFEGPVADDGFSDRVMVALAPRKHNAPWMLRAGAVIGAVACWLALGQAPVLRAGWQDWLRNDLSPSAWVLLLAVAVMSLLGMGWGLLEAEDGGGKGGEAR